MVITPRCQQRAAALHICSPPAPRVSRAGVSVGRGLWLRSGRGAWELVLDGGLTGPPEAGQEVRWGPSSLGWPWGGGGGHRRAVRGLGRQAGGQGHAWTTELSVAYHAGPGGGKCAHHLVMAELSSLSAPHKVLFRGAECWGRAGQWCWPLCSWWPPGRAAGNSE